MATTYQTIVNNARFWLNETTANFWTDTELFGYALDASRDLWKAIIDLHAGHFTKIDETGNVVFNSSKNYIDGVPPDLHMIELIEVLDQTTSSTVQNLTFEPRHRNHPDFTAARALGAITPSGSTIFFDLIGAGSPVNTPQILVAPQINFSTPLQLRLEYTATLPTLLISSNNPIPGESDHAIQAWVTAHALARQSEGQRPDATWLQVYSTDKDRIKTACTPRQTQEPDTAEALYEVYW